MQHLGMMGQDKRLISWGWVMAWLSSYSHVIVWTAICDSLKILFWLYSVYDMHSWTLKNLSAWNIAIFSVSLVSNRFLTQSKRFYFIVLVLNLKVLYIQLFIGVFMIYKHFKTLMCPVMAINTPGILKVV